MATSQSSLIFTAMVEITATTAEGAIQISSKITATLQSSLIFMEITTEQEITTTAAMATVEESGERGIILIFDKCLQHDRTGCCEFDMLQEVNFI